MQKVKKDRGWNIFTGWLPPQEKIQWNIFDEFTGYYKEFINEKHEDLTKLLKNWDAQLKELNGDPTYYDWSAFRPLRLTREEDWSDWLAHLIATSKTGDFCKFLFNLNDSFDFSEPQKVHRELSSHNYRADIIIEWKNDFYSHIEVKIGDENFSKTYGTGQAMRKKFGTKEKEWTDFILVLPEQLNSERLNEELHDTIILLSWQDVAVALRRALLGRETIVWKVWSWSFLGAIEQKLIDFPGYALKTKPEQSIDTKIEILVEGLKKKL